MDESPDDLTIKELLETYFRVEDLQKVLKSFELPFVGRKPELFERVVSLLNRRQYESEFITKVKRKVTQIYRQRVAPEVDREMGRKCSKNWNKINNKRNKTKKIVKKKRYEDDDSYEESSDSDPTTDLSLESSSDKSSTRSSFELELISKKNKNNEIENKSKKRKRVIISSSDESNETIDKESDDSSESSSNQSKNKTRKQNKIKNNNVINKNQKSSKTKKINKSKKKTEVVYKSSDSESSSDETLKSDSSDSDVVQKRTVKKKFLNINLSSDSEDNHLNHNNSSNTKPNNTNTDINNSVNNIEINNSESDDEIQILQIIPASEALNRRINTTQMKSYSEYSVFKDSSSSDTESSQDFDFNDEETQNICNNINDLVKSNPSLVIDTSFINTTQTCDSISDMTPENNEIPSNSGNNCNQLSNDNTTQLNNTIQSFKETTNQIIESFQLTNETLTQLSVKTQVKSEPKSELKAEIKTEEKRPILQQLPLNVEQTPKLRIINTPPIAFLENSPKMAETVSLRITAPTDTINFIKKRMNASGSSEVEAIDQSFKLSLICPITNKRIGLPGRSLQCQHIDCFDINTFIQLSSCKAMTLWKCPKCKLPANLPINRNGFSNFNANNIIIDGLIKHILSITDSSCDAVIFDNKAIWSPDIKYSDNYSNKAIKNEVVLLDNTAVEVIELDDDEDETPIDKVTSEIANAKSYANNTSNMLITQKQSPVINRSNPQIERIVEFLQSGSVEPQISRPTQNIQNVSLNQTLQTQSHKTLQSLLKPTEQQNRTHFQVQQQQQQQHQQQQQQIQKQNTIPSHPKYPTFHRNTDIQNRAPIPYTSGPQMNATHSQINNYRTNAMNQNPVVNNSSQSTAATNSSDHIKFEYDSGGLIKGVFCHICNVQIPVGTKNIEIHCNGEQHKRLKLSYNKIPNNSSQNRPLVQSTNQMMPSFHPRASPSSQINAQQTGYHNYNNSHSTNTTFEAPQYYTTQYQRYPNQVSQPMNPYYSQSRPQYQSSMPLPAHQTQGIPPAAHMTSQNTSQFTQMPNSYRSVAHYNQTYNPYNYS